MAASGSIDLTDRVPIGPPAHFCRLSYGVHFSSGARYVELILHHYPQSPFAEKARLLLGFKGLSWHSVLISPVMPKPDLTALTGGYRRTPVLRSRRRYLLRHRPDRPSPGAGKSRAGAVPKARK